MRLSKQHKSLMELVFYSDIRKYFENMENYRVDERENDKFWHDSGNYFFKVRNIISSPKYATLELYHSSVNHYFDSGFGYNIQEDIVATFLLSPRGNAPRRNSSILLSEGIVTDLDGLWSLEGGGTETTSTGSLKGISTL